MALKNEGCTHILATTAVGSLKEEIKMGDIVFVDQVFDRTVKRETTFYDGKPNSPKGVCHIPMHEPFCIETRKVTDYDYIISPSCFIKYFRRSICVNCSQQWFQSLMTCAIDLMISLQSPNFIEL